jgi:hypothetical protein
MTAKSKTPNLCWGFMPFAALAAKGVALDEGLLVPDAVATAPAPAPDAVVANVVAADPVVEAALEPELDWAAVDEALEAAELELLALLLALLLELLLALLLALLLTLLLALLLLLLAMLLLVLLLTALLLLEAEGPQPPLDLMLSKLPDWSPYVYVWAQP